MRVVAISATLPNIGDIANFLEANEVHMFDRSYRPVPLTTHVIGQGFVGNASNSQFKFWAGLDRNVPDIIHRFSNRKPAIVFCHSKANTEKLADLLATAHGIGSRSSTTKDMASKTKVSKLQRVLFHGIGYHHAGLEVDDRRLVEQSFTEGKIRVLCATSTLAMGVNLPAHLVVIRGTKAWRGGGSGYQDLDQASLLQMIGRAGRPGYDTSGTAVIMTDNKSKATFQGLMHSGLDPVVSKLATRIDEIINTEISQGVIRSKEDAYNWLRTTLLSIQLHNDPALFGIATNQNLDDYLLNLCTDSIKRLQAIGAVAANGGQNLVALEVSHTMSQNLVRYQAMQLFAELPFDAKQSQILNMLVDMQDFHQPVRRSEKRFLREAHKSLKHKLEGPLSKVTIQQPSQKAFVLLQASIGNLHVEDYTLRKEMTSMVELASRMLAALEEYSVRGTQHGKVVLESLKLRRTLATSIWSSQEGVLSQLIGVGTTTTFSLKLSGIATFGDVLGSSDEQIEKAAKRLPPFGSTLRKAVSKILRDTLKMSAHIVFAAGTRTPSHAVCELKRRDVALTDTERSKASGPEVSYTLVAFTDRPGGCLIYQRNVTEPGCYCVEVPQKFGNVQFHLIASLVGLDEKVELAGTEKQLDSESNLSSTTKARSFAVVNGRIRYTKSGMTGSTAKNRDNKAAVETASRARARRRAGNKNEFFSPKVTPSPKPGSSASVGQGFCSPQPASRQVNDPKAASNIYTSVGPLEGWQSGNTISQSAPRDTDDESRHTGHTAKRSYHSQSDGKLRREQQSWKKTKVRQQKAQQRAFVCKKDNPFSSYRHDPNDAENFLDTLSSQNSPPPSSEIIPPEGLHALASAYRVNSNRYASQAVHRRSQNDRRGPRRQTCLSGPELLAQKEAELYGDPAAQWPPSNNVPIGTQEHETYLTPEHRLPQHHTPFGSAFPEQSLSDTYSTSPSQSFQYPINNQCQQVGQASQYAGVAWGDYRFPQAQHGSIGYPSAPPPLLPDRSQARGYSQSEPIHHVLAAMNNGLPAMLPPGYSHIPVEGRGAPATLRHGLATETRSDRYGQQTTNYQESTALEDKEIDAIFF